MKVSKFPSLVLAVALQVLPISRVFIASTPATGSSFAIISTWIAGAFALLGGYDSVSGASSISITPTTATVGVRYTGVVQYSGSHAVDAKSWSLVNNWNGAQSGCNNVYQIAPGLWLTNSSTYLARVGGIPTASGTYSFTLKIHSGASCGGGDSDTRSSSITISAGTATAPTITSQPVGQTITAGGNTSFTVGASGTGTLGFQWRLNGVNLSAATGQTLNLTAVATNQAGPYTVVVNNSVGSVTSSPAMLIVNPAPVGPTITSQPVGQTITAGGNASFTVGASGTGTLGYQWRLNGANLSAATGQTLNLTAVATNQAGPYTVVVNNSVGSVTSSPAMLIVNPAPVGPTITSQPVGQTITAGGNASFTVGANGTGTLGYQWRLNGANLSAATGQTLNLTAVATNQAGPYTVVVNNSVGSVTSSPAILIVNPAPVGPTITSQPVGQTITAGGNASFTVGANGTGTLGYQWRLNGANLSAATSQTLNLTGVATNQAGPYTVVVNNSVGSVTSSPAMLIVNPAPVGPTITSQPVGQTITAGGNASFTVGANGTGTLGYQWRLNGANLSAATGQTLSLTAVATNQAGPYTVVVNNSVGSITSSPAMLIVNPAPVGPTITSQPVGQTITAGGNASFTVGANGTGTLGYQWRLNGANLSAATSQTLSLTAVATNQAGPYTVVVNNSVGSVTSSPAMLIVNPAPVGPTITSQPVGQTITAGGNASFTVVANGTGTLGYQWRLNGANLSAATSQTLNLTAVATNQAGPYTVVVNNSVGSVTSSPAMLIVNPAPVGPTITSQPVGQTITAGGNASFTVGANGTGTLGYQWRLNGANLSAATSQTLNLTGVATNQAGSYTVVVNNSVGSVTSSPALLVVTAPVINEAPTISAISNHVTFLNTATPPIPFTIGDGETAASNLTVFATSSNPALVSDGDVVLSGGGSNRTVTVTPSSGGTGDTEITISVSDGNATSSTTFRLVVSSPLPPQVTLLKQGQGTISPDVSLMTLTLGKTYKVTAVPAVGQVFAGWTGGVNSMSPTITFVASSNLTLVATFVPSPYIPAAGNYSGLFYESDAVEQQSAGYFTLTVSPRGSYSAHLLLGGNKFKISGQLDLDCKASSLLVRKNTNSLNLELRVGMNDEAGKVFGKINDGNWAAALVGDRAVFNARMNPSPYAANYTMVILGGEEQSSLPMGAGYGTVQIRTSGSVRFTGALADGTKVSQSTTISADGYWPLYASLYKRQGLLLGWLAFAGRPEDDLGGTLSWIKPADAQAAFYTNGFKNEFKATGAIYTIPDKGAGQNLLDLTSGMILFSGGNLASNVTDSFILGPNSRITLPEGNKGFSLKFSTSQGTFSGKRIDPTTGRSRAFQGAVLQNQNIALGFMLGTNQSSQVLIKAQDGTSTLPGND